MFPGSHPRITRTRSAGRHDELVRARTGRLSCANADVRPALGRCRTTAQLNGDLRSVLDSVESLRGAWPTVVAQNSESFREGRRRSLRRHAIETGIIERLYDVDWGVTEALVAEA